MCFLLAHPRAVGLLGVIFYLRWRRLGLSLLIIAALSMWVLSMPVTAAWIARLLETIPPFEPDQLSGKSVDAIVILSGGAYSEAPEFEGLDTVL